MKGLLFVGGRQPDPLTAQKIIGKYDVCVAADSGLDSAHQFGIKPDYVIGDMDSIRDKTLLNAFLPERIIEHPREKDCTDTELGLLLLDKLGVDEIILIGGSGGRLDHFLAVRSLFEMTVFPSVWISEETVAVACGKGSAYTGCKLDNLNTADPVSVFPFGFENHTCQTDGFYWKLETVLWDKNQFSLSNKSVSGKIQFVAVSGLFLVMFPLSGAIDLYPLVQRMPRIST